MLCMLQMVVLATIIDIGNPAIDRATSLLTDRTYIDRVNPANASGIINKVEIYVDTPGMFNIKIATFYVVDGNNLSTRDSEAVDDVGSAGYHSFDVNIDVEAGDYIGIYMKSGTLDRSTAGTGHWYLAGDQIPCSNVTFTPYSDDTMSLYGTGATIAVAKKKNVIFMGSNF